MLPNVALQLLSRYFGNRPALCATRGFILFLALLGANRADSSELRDSPVRVFDAKNFSLSIPSSECGAIFARLEARAIVRRKTSILGTSLAISSPGYSAVGLKLSLFPVACSASDWDTLLAALSGLAKNQSAMKGGLFLLLPDGNHCISPRPPEISDGEIRLGVGSPGRVSRQVVIFRQPDGLISTSE